MSTSRLTAIEIEGFRGFAEPCRLDLDADVLLIHGDNGSGKTSLVDALLWLFTGDVPRLAERAKGTRREADALVNCYAGDSARVCLSVTTGDGRELTFERRGSSKSHQLDAWEGGRKVADASELLSGAFGDFAEAQLAEAVQTWGILQQHAIGAALESGAALHQRLSAVIGLERITAFADGASKTAKQLMNKRRQLGDVHKRLTSQLGETRVQLRQEEETAEEPDAARRILAENVERAAADLPEGIRLSAPPPDLDTAAAQARRLTEVVEMAAKAAADQDALAAAQKAITVATGELEEELAKLRLKAQEAVQSAPARVQLAGAALELLDGAGQCPACGQTVDEASLREHLTETLNAAHETAAAAGEAQQAVAKAQTQLLAAQEAEERAKQLEAGGEQSLGALRSALEQLTSLEVDEQRLAGSALSELAAALEQLLHQLRSAVDAASRDQSGVVARLRSEAQALEREVARAERDHIEAQDHWRRADMLDKAAHRAAERIVEQALQQIQPTFAEVFDRLTTHSTFTELRAKQDIYYGNNQVVPDVVDRQQRLAKNPMLVFSAGQLDVVALSYFLGLALNARDGALPFMVLDDPLQSMDVVNALGFADLCRRVREHRQLIVTTHDRRFASLLARKLAPSEASARTIVHEFGGWTREGPSIVSSEEPLAEVVPLLSRKAS